MNLRVVNNLQTFTKKTDNRVRIVLSTLSLFNDRVKKKKVVSP